MKLIAGLGNPGDNYFNTRHNIGFAAIDKLCDLYNIKLNLKHKALINLCEISGQKIIFVKPQTYMNLSGLAIKEIASYYKINSQNIIIIHDDLDIKIGNIKIKHNGSSGGHNGIKNIIQELGTQDFIRIRIGIDKKPEDWELNNYVLGKFSDEQKDFINHALDLVCDAVNIIIKKDVFGAMNKFNTKPKSDIDN